ncbi:MAG: MBL fold metallo-hydrolase [Clostridia bacterium]|nr:MBL fold metallo-hydrolase [Clostridia bacterium]
MLVKVLIENTSLENQFVKEHGLSLYIEHDGQKILFDMGQSMAYLKNADMMSVSLDQVDFAVVSHCHYDHIGGLYNFLEHYEKPVYIQEKGKHEFYSCKTDCKEIGIHPEWKLHPNIHWINGNYAINASIHLMKNNSNQWPMPEMNQHLFTKKENIFIHDPFLHEQSLIIKGQKDLILITGCSHNGIMNIIESVKNIYQHYPKIVIGGFHLSSDQSDFQDSKLEAVAKALKNLDIQCYTGHCTGMKGYEVLKSVLGCKCNRLSSGQEININVY